MIQIPVDGFVNSLGFSETTCVLELKAECANDSFQDTQPMKKEKVTEAERFTKDVYKKAACEFGIIIHNEETGYDFIAVNSEDWRKTFMITAKSPKENVKRAQYSKARKILLEEKCILFEKEINGQTYDCLKPNNNDTFESSIRINISQRENNNTISNE